MGEWAEAWPVGLRFKPTEYELVRHHLTRKLRGEIEAICLIPELYIYDWEPPELFARYNELSSIPSDGSECFFFCPRGRKRKRKTQCGFWKETSTIRPVQAPGTGEEIGLRRSMVYHEGQQGNARRTKFGMYEYHLNSNISDSEISDPTALVLCHIAIRKSKKAKSAMASTSTDLSGPTDLNDSQDEGTLEIGAQASPGVTAEFPYPDETSDFDLPDRNVPAPDQQPQTSEEQRLSYDDHRPYSPSDGINLVDLLNFDEGTDSMPNQSDNASV
ncbi:protein NTM1-like 9 isoform X2 [Rhodamnia argentea]|uniref:Protein NTM1-like 9 isoform X2 n=1 Tax=Rhodamnia argentea TaxID=178133 RepID=A0ABM3HE26_9MYRT|nr:protein NTM1-like 9 isoform X2 [Rhodamnia argentea]